MQIDLKTINSFTVIMIASGLMIMSCNPENKQTTSDNVLDTSSIMKVDSSALNNISVTPPTTITVDSGLLNKGVAVPNLKKKGLKGKTTITLPTKGTGSMDMDNEGVYSNVEFLPSFPGGNKGLQKFFDDNLEYPAAATDDGVEGTVNISFVVDENGKLTLPKIQGAPLGYGLEAEALRVVNKMPNWNPGKLKGKNVKTKFTLPVTFQLY